jgi:hypothetical protein
MNAHTLLTAASLGLLALSTAVGFFACDGEDLPPQSGEYPVDALNVFAKAESNGLQVLVTASLGAEGVGIEVGAGDELYVEDATGASQRLGIIIAGYGALLDSDAGEVDLVLRRASGEVRGTLAMPEPFALELLVTEGELGSTVELNWPASNDGSNVWLAIYGDCLPTPLQRKLLADEGTYVIQPGELSIDPNISPCTLSVELHRDGVATEAGFGDPSGRWTGSQVRTAALEVAP